MIWVSWVDTGRDMEKDILHFITIYTGNPHNFPFLVFYIHVTKLLLCMAQIIKGIIILTTNHNWNFISLKQYININQLKAKITFYSNYLKFYSLIILFPPMNSVHLNNILVYMFKCVTSET